MTEKVPTKALPEASRDGQLEETDLQEQNRLLREENERLKKEREEYRKTLPVKERLYDHINVSLKTMDMIIAVLFILLGIVFVMGILTRGG